MKLDFKKFSNVNANNVKEWQEILNSEEKIALIKNEINKMEFDKKNPLIFNIYIALSVFFPLFFIFLDSGLQQDIGMVLTGLLTLAAIGLNLLMSIPLKKMLMEKKFKDILKVKTLLVKITDIKNQYYPNEMLKLIENYEVCEAYQKDKISENKDFLIADLRVMKVLAKISDLEKSKEKEITAFNELYKKLTVENEDETVKIEESKDKYNRNSSGFAISEKKEEDKYLEKHL